MVHVSQQRVGAGRARENARHQKSGVLGQELVNKITIRLTSGIDVNMRVVYNGSTYLIQDVTEMDDRVEMTTMRLST